MKGRDSKGNTEEEVHDLFFEWLDDKCSIPQLFEELPKITYSDLVVFYQQKYNHEFYGDMVFDLWNKNIYNKQ